MGLVLHELGLLVYAVSVHSVIQETWCMWRPTKKIFPVSSSTLVKLCPHGWSQVETNFFLPVLHIAEWALAYCCLWVPM